MTIAATVVAVLTSIVALFQVALVLGAPLGDAVFGGRAETRDGVLAPQYRALAGFQALILVSMGWIVLGLADVLTAPLSDAVLRWAAWAIVGLMVLNTAGNLTSPHPLERWGMSSVTIAIAASTAFVALQAPNL